ncbi:MAG: TatD family hydrolase [Patescibacteria group bacterium]|nr:TatD family hydrolase [Patescibacteria group bacterium]
MIDTHAHLDFPEFDQDREEVISRFFENGGRAIINIGVDLERSWKSIEIAKKHKGVFASVGLHPDFFMKHGTHNMEQDFDELRILAKHEKVVAIGETGLDYFRIKKPDFSRGNPVSVEEIKESQKRGFLAQIELARELNLPVIVHCREAWSDVYEIISGFLRFSLKNEKSTGGSSKVRPPIQGSTFPLSRSDRDNSPRSNLLGIPQGQTFFVLHCYSGEEKDTEKFLKLPNVFFSFSGNITYPKPAERAAKLAEAVKMIPLDKIMLDSDAPFLAPQKYRGKRNEPAHVKFIVEKIAEVKNVSVAEVKRTTDENAIEFFSMDAKSARHKHE